MLCKTCNKYAAEAASKTCLFCRQLQFPENIICEITRGSQEKRKTFMCSTFRPKLLLAGEKEKSEQDPGSTLPPLTEKQKYNLAKALQLLQRNPEDIAHSLKYHLCFAVKKREPLFLKAEPYIEKIVTCFEDMEPKIPGIIRAKLLWLAPDHVHAYFKATPDRAVDRIAAGMKKKLAELSCALLAGPWQRKKTIWEKFYFSRTIG